MKQPSIVILIVLFTAAILFGADTTYSPLANPSILFARPIPPEANRNEIGFDVLPLSDGALITGSTAAASGGPPDGLILRVTDQGDVVWRKSYGGSGLDLIFSCLPDANGFVCVGFKAPTGEGSMKAMDGWIFRIDDKGTVTWEHTYGGSGEDRLTGIKAIPGGYIAVGHTEVPNAGIRAWILRIDPAGKELSSWNGSGKIAEKGLDVIPLPDGGSILCGGVGESREASDGFVARLSAKGEVIWTHTIGGPGFQVGYHLQPFRDGSILSINYGHTDDARKQEVIMKRISADGKVIYSQTFGGPTNDRATNALILENDSIVVAGQTQRAGAADEDCCWDGILYLLNPEGKPVWSSRYGGSGVEFGRAAQGTADRVWIIGHTTSVYPTSSVMLIRMDVAARSEL